MSNASVFYSWQSDLPNATNRGFIQQAVENAIKRVNRNYELIHAPRLEQDTQGTPGIPAIAATILRKITGSAIFLADVSFTAKAFDSEKLVPNANVMLELGYAIQTLGWNRMLLVMNTKYGDASHLPFDLRHRRFPFQYSLDEGSDKRHERERLSAHLERSITAMIEAEHQRVEDVSRRIDGISRVFIRENYTKSHFWEVEPTLKGLVSHRDDCLKRLVDFEILDVVPHTNENGYAYTWTYFGKLCLKFLGNEVPNVPMPEYSNFAENVYADFNGYGDLLPPAE